MGRNTVDLLSRFVFVVVVSNVKPVTSILVITYGLSFKIYQYRNFSVSNSNISALFQFYIQDYCLELSRKMKVLRVWSPQYWFPATGLYEFLNSQGNFQHFIFQLLCFQSWFPASLQPLTITFSELLMPHIHLHEHSCIFTQCREAPRLICVQLQKKKFWKAAFLPGFPTQKSLLCEDYHL